MNIFKKTYARTFQFCLKLSLPILPYRTPKILHSDEEILSVLVANKIKSVLLVTDKGVRGLGLTKPLEELLSKNLKLTVFDETKPNPTTNSVEEAYKLYLANNCEAVIGFGGGSPMDLAKATLVKTAYPKKPLIKFKGILKVRKKLPLLICIPTTAGTGSETTLAAVITDSETRHKFAINDFPLIPKYAGLNPSLLVNLPSHLTASTGMDALTHAVEAYIGRSTTKETRNCAIEATSLIFENLLTTYYEPNNLEARRKMLIAAYKAGIAFTKSYVGYVHAIAHSLGGKYDIPHGVANAIILPYVLKAYGRKVHKKLWQLGYKSGIFPKTTSKEVGAKIFIENIEMLNEEMKLGSKIDVIQEKDIESLAKTAEKEANPLYPVPVMFTAKELEKIYLEVKNG